MFTVAITVNISYEGEFNTCVLVVVQLFSNCYFIVVYCGGTTTILGYTEIYWFSIGSGIFEQGDTERMRKSKDKHQCKFII